MNKKEDNEFNISRWEYTHTVGNYRIFYNSATGTNCEEHVIKVISHKERENYEKRKWNTDQNLVRIYDCEAFSNYNQNRIFTHYTLRVYLQRISTRLHEIGRLPNNKIYVSLMDTLLGYKKIFEEFQPVRVTASMIGFNQKDKIKVWLSEDYLENYQIGLREYVSEKIMVNDIFRIYSRFTNHFQDKPENCNFQEAIQYVGFKMQNGSTINDFQQPTMHKDYSKSRFGDKNKPVLHDYVKRNTVTSQSINQVDAQSVRRLPSQHGSLVDRPISNISISKKMHNHSTSSNKSHFLNYAQSKKMLMPHNAFENIINNMSSDRSIPYEDSNISSPINAQIVKPLKAGTINIESARTTSKQINNLSFVELDKNELQLELLDDKKSKETKLNLIEQTMERTADNNNVKKICKIFKHAIKYDPIMYHELQKVQGRISKISNHHILNRLITISEGPEKKEEFEHNRFKTEQIHHNSINPSHIRNILEQQRAKRKYNSNVRPIELKPAEKQQGCEYVKQLEKFVDSRVKTKQSLKEKKQQHQRKNKKQITRHEAFKEQVEKLLFQ